MLLDAIINKIANKRYTIEDTLEWEVLYKISPTFRKYVYISKHSKSKRIRNKNLKKINSELEWININNVIKEIFNKNSFRK